MAKKILICGLTGAGKTTLARELQKLTGAAVFDGDAVRDSYPCPLGFSETDRRRHAAFMGKLCDAVTAGGNNAIASFVCPTEATRAAFSEGGPAFVVWIDRYGDKKYADTQRLWEDPAQYDLRVTNQGTPYFWATQIYDALYPPFSPRRQTALFVGRYQPFHEGHKRLIEHGIRKWGQVCIGVRDTTPAFPYDDVRQRIELAMREHTGRFMIVPLPNIVSVMYGRDVGYEIERVVLDPATESVSATDKRKQMEQK